MESIRSNRCNSRGNKATAPTKLQHCHYPISAKIKQAREGSLPGARPVWIASATPSRVTVPTCTPLRSICWTTPSTTLVPSLFMASGTASSFCSMAYGMLSDRKETEKVSHLQPHQNPHRWRDASGSDAILRGAEAANDLLAKGVGQPLLGEQGSLEKRVGGAESAEISAVVKNGGQGHLKHLRQRGRRPGIADREGAREERRRRRKERRKDGEKRVVHQKACHCRT